MVSCSSWLLLASNLVFELRPFVADGDTVQLLAHGADNSFPSDHATLATIVAAVASLAWRRWAWLFLTVAAMVGVARVLSRVHYPGDIIAGWTIGGIAALIAWMLVGPERFKWRSSETSQPV